jgi:hypothetical protein
MFLLHSSACTISEPGHHLVGPVCHRCAAPLGVAVLHGGGGTGESPFFMAAAAGSDVTEAAKAEKGGDAFPDGRWRRLLSGACAAGEDCTTAYIRGVRTRFCGN